MTARRGQPVRRAMQLANTNAIVWAVGNGLVSTTLIIYLALELGAAGIAVSLILAAPRFVGVLRLAVPSIIQDGNRRKFFCICGYTASALVLLALPALATPRESLSTTTGIRALVVCWCVYHLLEYLATIALWSWLGDWMPPRVRGRLIGWRERYLVVGRIVGIAGSVAITGLWTALRPDSPRWEPLACSAMVGAAFLLLAVLPLVILQPIDARRVSPTRPPLAYQLALALTDPAYRRLLAYSCWFAVANGMTGAAQSLYPQRVLGIDYLQMVGLRSMMFAGQTAIAPAAGRWIDARGARGLLTLAQLIVATGPLLFLAASPTQPWWIVGAFVVWIAYAAINVGLDDLKLKLAPTASTAPALAVYYALGDLASGVTLVAGGTLYDRLTAGGTDALQLYAQLFLAGWLCRSLAAWLAWCIPTGK